MWQPNGNYATATNTSSNLVFKLTHFSQCLQKHIFIHNTCGCFSGELDTDYVRSLIVSNCSWIVSLIHDNLDTSWAFRPKQIEIWAIMKLAISWLLCDSCSISGSIDFEPSIWLALQLTQAFMESHLTAVKRRLLDERATLGGVHLSEVRN